MKQLWNMCLLHMKQLETCVSCTWNNILKLSRLHMKQYLKHVSTAHEAAFETCLSYTRSSIRNMCLLHMKQIWNMCLLHMRQLWNMFLLHMKQLETCVSCTWSNILKLSLLHMKQHLKRVSPAHEAVGRKPHTLTYSLAKINCFYIVCLDLKFFRLLQFYCGS